MVANSTPHHRVDVLVCVLIIVLKSAILFEHGVEPHVHNR